ncbi:MAG: M23 family metallopeptidase [Clostridia bacterium]|nr:M23 family metallopeptidase [Clostridia bacterium]
MNFILGKKTFIGTNDKKRLTALIAIGVMIMLAISLVGTNYKVAYKVTLNGSVLGYIKDKEEFACMITNKVLNQDNENMELVILNELPQYSLSLVSKNESTNEEAILKILKLKAEVTYKLYAITLNGEDKAYVDTMEEAQNKVNELTEQYKENLDSEFGIREVYTDNVLEYKNMKYATINELDGRLNDEKKAKEEAARKAAEEAAAKKAAEEAAAKKAAEEEKAKKAALTQSYAPVEHQNLDGVKVAGVSFSVSPVSGRISSRYGANESIRNHTHKGLDIAASNGTPIYAVADGQVEYAQYNNGGYGNLVRISHGNGVETYYAHCSKLYVSAGQHVTAGTCIGAVGSTGRSTGNHLHFEIRINGSQVNPQNYLYN